MTSACPSCSAIAPPAPAAAPSAQPSALVLSLPTLRCAGCIGTVERGLLALPGVRSARVNLSLKRVTIDSDLPTHVITNTLKSLGYEAHPLNTSALADTSDPAARDLLMRLGVAGFAMMNVMLLSVAVWSGAMGATRDLFHLISAVIAVPAVAYSGQPFFRNAVAALRVRSLNMDVPISLAILLAVGMSVYETLHGGQHAYFDAALSLTFFLLAGRYLDHRTRGAARSAAQELTALEAHTVQHMQNGKAQDVPIDEIALGDTILIPTGMRVPLDGTLLTAEATTDCSFLTGESAPVTSRAGRAVQAGEVNMGAPFTLTVTAIGTDTTLRRLSTLVEMAENARNRYTALADRAARVYAPLVHLLALAAFIGWAMWDGDIRHALNVAIAVLIITCPCALGLAVPAVSSAAIGRLYSMGQLVKSGTALERLAEVDTVVFDKTGTLTLPGVDLAATDIPDGQKPVALALAQASAHPYARMLAEALNDVQPSELTNITEHPGQGVSAMWQGTQVQLGNGRWLQADFNGLGLRVGANATQIKTTEQFRPGAKIALNQLHNSGKRLILMSGDKTDAVQNMAFGLPFDAVHAEIKAGEKHALLTQMASEGHKCAMVGDGLNDAASLAAAHVSLAPASALDAARAAADIVILRQGLTELPDLFAIARKSSHLSRQNFGIAAGYNMIAVPIALAGMATPLMAALAMSTSSLTVLLNALRVRWQA